MPFFLTRLNVGDYDAWKPMFDDDGPGARRGAKGHRIFRTVGNPSEVFILVEFDSADDTKDGRTRLLDSGILNRFADKTDPVVIEESENIRY